MTEAQVKAQAHPCKAEGCTTTLQGRDTLCMIHRGKAQAQVKAAQAQAQVKVKAEARAQAEAHPIFTRGGDKARCQVLVKSSGVQCQNPLNYQFRGHGTCHTHLNRLEGMTPARLKTVRWTDKVIAYDHTLWGAPSEAQVKAQAAPQAASKRVKASQVKVKAQAAPQVKAEAQAASQAEA